MTLDQIIREVQGSLPGVTQDGRAGPETWGAIYRLLVKHDEKPVPAPALSDISTVDERSETAIQTLNPQVRPLARALVHQAALEGLTIKVTSGTRTFAEQDALYAQGRTKPGKIVTNARAGFSNHNFGVAFDVTLFKGNEPVWESPAYKAIAAMGKAMGLTWGGDWASIDDEPHFELHPPWAAGLSENAVLAGLRERKAEGLDAFA